MNRKSTILDALPRASRAFLALNGLDGGQDRPQAPGAKPGPADGQPTPAPPIRQRRSTGSKLQTAFLEELRRTHPQATVLEEAITLELANGCRYRPDAIVVHQDAKGLKIEAFEVKGFLRDDAGVKLKVAARSYPWITFYLTTRRTRSGPWEIHRVES